MADNFLNDLPSNVFRYYTENRQDIALEHVVVGKKQVKILNGWNNSEGVGCWKWVSKMDGWRIVFFFLSTHREIT